MKNRLEERRLLKGKMAKELRLEEGYLDNNLRPLKMDGEKTSLEIAKSGARVSGDLHVNDELTCDSIVCESINPVSILGTPTFVLGQKEGVTISSATTSLDAATYVALDVNLIKFGSSTSTNTIKGLDVSATSAYATDGFNKLYGVYSLAYLTHAADAGTPSIWGGYFKATGSTNGTSIVIGIESEVTALGDTTYGLKINTPDGADADIHIISSADSGDYFQIATTTNGVTTISTVDDDGEGADLIFNIDGYIDLNSASGEDITLDSGGDIILDSADGNFIAKNNGTEFSATNSAYAGMILGYTRIANNQTGSSDNIITLDGTMTVLQTAQGTDVKVTFIAPPSQCVEIQFSCLLYTNSTTVAFALSDNASFNEVDETHTYDQGSYKMDETDLNTIVISWAITTGLTAGTSYTYYIAGKETLGSTGVIYHGRFRSTGNHYPPMIVKAIALPNDGQSPDHFLTGE